MISHDLDFVAENFDRVIRLRRGRVWQDLPVRLFFEQNAGIDAEAIHNPQIARLSRALGQQRLARTVDEFLENQQVMAE